MRYLLLASIAVIGCGPGGSDDMGVGDMTMQPAHCSNAMKDGDESDVDCGGSCAPCIDGKMCQHGPDCMSGVCTNATCSSPSCSDGVKNGFETDVDCGGGLCSGCPNGKMCKLSGDCVSKTCTNNTCAMSQCSDGMQDGKETDVDCGGDTCSPCGDGKMCLNGPDCASGTCQNNVCKGGGGSDGGVDVDMAAPTCSDGVQDGTETDVDCGGGTCGKCGGGKMCKQPSDCLAGKCTAGKCGGAPLALNFAPQVEYANPGTNPQMVAVGDLDGDGKQDLAVPNLDSSNVTVFINGGAGVFKPGVTYGGTGQVDWISVGDMNNDGKRDLVGVASTVSVEVWLNQGAGTFANATTYPTGGKASPFCAAVGDFDKDGKLDVALGNTDPDNSVSVLTNQGAGVLNPAVLYPVGQNPYGIAVADIDADGKADIVASARQSNAISVLLNAGNGTFKAATSYSIGAAQQPWGVGVADFNGDGKLDIVTGNETNNVTVFLNGSFQAPSVYPTTANGETIALTVNDFNVDGQPDVAVMSNGDGVISVLLNQGGGVLKAAQTTFPVVGGTAYMWLASGDFNSDGKPDIVATSNGANKIYVFINSSQ